MNQQRIDHMIAYVAGLREGKIGLDWFEQYRSDIQTLQPEELFDVFNTLLQQGITAEEILTFLDRVTNVIYNDMTQKEWKKPEPNSFLGVLMSENAGLVEHLVKITEILKNKQIITRQEELLDLVAELGNFGDHYSKKENILFPMMEKADPKFEGVSIMWALHDEIRKEIKEAIDLLKITPVNETQVNVKVGSLFFTIRSLVIKEEMILFPTATSLFNETEMAAMYDQMFEYSFPFIKTPPRLRNENESSSSSLDNLVVHTSTGDLTFEQVELLFNALPLDLSYVDENNRLRYFSKPKDRFFPRSIAAIGRDVKNCHPPKSVDTVMEIIDAFRNGKQDSASFWIHLKGRFVLIQYFAVRNEKGEYKGVLEASQDITDIQSLEGERRLVSWGK